VIDDKLFSPSALVQKDFMARINRFGEKFSLS